MNNLAVVQSNFKCLALITASEMLAVILIGALGRAANTGLSWLESAYWAVLCASVLLTLFTAFVGWRNYRPYRLIWGPALAAVAAVSGVALLAATSASQGWGVVAGLLLMAAHLGLLLFAAIAAALPSTSLNQTGVSGSSQRSYLRFLLFTGAAILLLLLTGTVVSGSGAGLSCPDWPLCEGEIFPANPSLEMLINLTHRFSVLAVGVAVAAIVLQTRRRYPQHALLVKAATALGLLFSAQVALGGLNVVLKLPGFMSAAHLTLAMTIWGSLVILASSYYLTAKSTLPLEEEPEPIPNSPLVSRQKAAVYFKLTKPWILVLLLITTAGAMFIAAEGVPSISLILYTLLGGALAASGASVLNSYVDSDIDQLMSRTSRRPTVTGLVTPQETLFFGLSLSTLSFLVFTLFVNPLSAALSTLGILYYVFFYTLYLKRATIHNIIIGGAAGAIPPLVGWTAVTHSLDLGALYLFAIIFFWTPPHTWALALLVKKDYANARVPMLPVVVGEKETTYQIFLYSILLITLTVLPFVAQVMGWLYLLGAVALGVPFLYLAWALWRNYQKSSSKKLYKFSQLYLALLFLLMALDRTLL
ncbi:MAG: protoheme IX farnesyltransferase [Anaerolineae bacterium]|nr:protoheme IX farnesyltransferase [Anaerolineales bacterium]MCQ3972148.1 protoheme IX farnesyltransferase [Anaerolineae bacterium]